MYFIDGHCDTLSKALDENMDLNKNDLQFSFDRANKLGGGIQIMACFVDTEFLNSKNAGFIRCNNILGKLKEYEENNNCKVLIENKEEVEKAKKSNDTKVILSIENGSAISGNLDNVEYFYNQGVRMMSITWNDDNELGCGAKTRTDKGLTKLGNEYVKTLDKRNIIIDVSHSSEKTFWDVISIAKRPVVASHSNVYEICNNPRNIKDSQIKAIAKTGGIIGICFYSDFLNSNSRANVKDIVEHIKYIKKIVGINYIGLGSDFDGMNSKKTAEGLENISKVNNIIKELEIQGFSCEEIVKIMWKNWYRLLKNL
ncbi:MAG: dipeptidase [Clostridia bacterium]|nr:dipeptidase [Clostridia bacterium]